MHLSTTSAIDPLLQVQRLAVDYRTGWRHKRAVEDITFDISAGETLGLVGESGSGKTTIGQAVLGLVASSDGQVVFEGHDLATVRGRERRKLSPRLQAVFQDPYSSLSPTKTVGYTLAEPLRVHGLASRAEARSQAIAMLARVGLEAAAVDRYPAQFSGGQRQRIAIARALMLSPRLLICDEAVSALDLSVQAEVVNLLQQFQRELGLGILFISHDLAVVRHISNRLVVLKHGRIVEHGDADHIYDHPETEYTRALIAASPVPDPELQRARRRGASAA